MTSGLHLGQRLQLRIDKLAKGGDGIGRYDNVVIFIPLVAPGDLVSIQITEVKPHFARGRVENLLEPSPHRASPPCPYFESCGGCSWQHVSYEQQLSQKQAMIQEYLHRSLAGLSPAINAIIPSPKTLYYRNRIRLRYAQGQLGYLKRKSHQLIPIDQCLIAESRINEALLEYKKRPINPHLKALQIFMGQTKAHLKEIFETETASNDGGESFVSTETAFSQVNTEQNQILIGYALSLIKETPEVIYDLYCGSGNLTFSLRERFKNCQIYAVELNAESIQQADQILQNKKLSPHKTRFYLTDVELFLKRHAIIANSTVVLDPPRSGCSPGVVKALAFSSIKQLIYVSCDFVTFARDYKLLNQHRKNCGDKPMKLVSIQPLDMFPQTDHIEMVALIEPS